MIRFHNTLGGKVEEFTPITPGKVGMYHCGPTVYDHVHIGNLRSFVLADLLRRLFEYEGFEVNQVMNITDLGHLVSDGDIGEDKMTKGLLREGLEVTSGNMKVLAEKYTEKFKEDISKLNILLPHHLPKASEHLKQQEALIKNLQQKGIAYTLEDGIYFDTSKDSSYGKLGGISENTQGRIAENTSKRNPKDFALWKFDSKLGFESELGKGFPGWHIECSAMSMEYLGETFDIHTGGIDLAPIHHNNEIAQSECATGKPFAKYWLHNEFVNMGEKKMAKSDGNILTISTLIEKGYSPLAYRYFLLGSHYRTPTSFSWEALEASENAYKRLKLLLKLFKSNSTNPRVSEKYKQEFTEAIENDLNIPDALAVVWKLAKNAGDDITYDEAYGTLLDFDKVLGLKLDENEFEVTDIPEQVKFLLEERLEARKNKDFARSDALRNNIQELGYDVKDTEKGQEISRI
jgi:cysteinyl-tRNA synthetase